METGQLLNKAFDSSLRERGWASTPRGKAGSDSTGVPTPVDFPTDSAHLNTSGAPVQAGLACLPADKRGEYARILKAMHLNGQLFVEDQGRLRRANPIEIRQQLDGEDSKAVVVTALATQSEFSAEARDEFSAQAGGLLLWMDASAQRQASDRFGASETIQYTSSPLKSWTDLEFAVPDAGVTGTPFLPASGGSVSRSQHWENQWLDRSASSSEVGGGWLGAGVSGKNDEGFSSGSTRVRR